MPGFGQITPAQAFRLIGTPDAPTVLDVRTEDAVAALPRLLPTAGRVAHTAIARLSEGAAGLLALSVGLSRMCHEDLQQVAAGLTLYDALYPWARDGHEEGHDWPKARKT